MFARVGLSATSPASLLRSFAGGFASIPLAKTQQLSIIFYRFVSDKYGGKLVQVIANFFAPRSGSDAEGCHRKAVAVPSAQREGMSE